MIFNKNILVVVAIVGLSALMLYHVDARAGCVWLGDCHGSQPEGDVHPCLEVTSHQFDCNYLVISLDPSCDTEVRVFPHECAGACTDIIELKPGEREALRVEEMLESIEADEADTFTLGWESATSSGNFDIHVTFEPWGDRTCDDTDGMFCSANPMNSHPASRFGFGLVAGLFLLGLFRR